jgi:hypothetical protein
VRSISQCAVSHSVQYLTVYSISQCAVSHSVQYLIVYSISQCAVSRSVQYPTVCSIAQCTVSHSVQYLAVYSISQCSVSHSVQYLTTYHVHCALTAGTETRTFQFMPIDDSCADRRVLHLAAYLTFTPAPRAGLCHCTTQFNKYDSND